MGAWYHQLGKLKWCRSSSGKHTIFVYHIDSYGIRILEPNALALSKFDDLQLAYLLPLLPCTLQCRGVETIFSMLSSSLPVSWFPPTTSLSSTFLLYVFLPFACGLPSKSSSLKGQFPSNTTASNPVTSCFSSDISWILRLRYCYLRSMLVQYCPRFRCVQYCWHEYSFV